MHWSVPYDAPKAHPAPRLSSEQRTFEALNLWAQLGESVKLFPVLQNAAAVSALNLLVQGGWSHADRQAFRRADMHTGLQM